MFKECFEVFMVDYLWFLKFKIHDFFHGSAGKVVLGFVVFVLGLLACFWFVNNDASYVRVFLFKSAALLGIPFFVVYLLVLHYKRTFALTKDLAFFNENNIDNNAGSDCFTNKPVLFKGD